MKIVWAQLPNDLDRTQFSSGLESVDNYFQKYAGQNHKSRLAICYVALTEDRSTVVGFYTLSASEIARASIPPDTIKGLPRYPVPAIRIGQLGVDQKFQGQGLGKTVLAHALRTVVQNDRYGAAVVVVDSKTARSTEFYVRHGFVPLLDRPTTLVLPVKTAAKALSDVSR